MLLELKDIQRFLPHYKNEKSAAQWLNEHAGPLCLACSGGPDSMGLLLWTRYYYPKKPCILLHFNHRIRSISDNEAHRLKILAEKLDIPIEIGQRNSNAYATEAELRDARYQFFEKMLKLHNASVLLLGHHQDDLFETTFMRLVRGSSLEGLIAPKPIQKTRWYTKVRPLLNFSKQDLQAACEHVGIEYFIDETNATDMCLRNRIRHHILNPLNDILGNNWREGFARTCSILAEQREYLNACVEKKLSVYDFTKTMWNYSVFKSMPIYECQCFLQKLFYHHGILNYTFEFLQRIILEIRKNAEFSININPHYRLIGEGNALNLITLPKKNVSVFNLFWKHGMIVFPNGTKLFLKQEKFSEKLYSDIKQGCFSHRNVAILDSDRISSVKWVRSRCPGDRYQPLNFGYEKKVKDLLIDHKINKIDKENIPVICDKNGDIAWIPGLPPAEKFKIQKNSKLCVFLVYKNL